MACARASQATLTSGERPPTFLDMAKRQTAAERGISYASKRKEGWLLAHNHVRPEADTPHGWQGFRRFWVSPEKMKEHDWPLCECGWRPDLGPHYSGLAEKAE